MVERAVVLDETVMDEQSVALRNAVERAERAEAELAKLKAGGIGAGAESKAGSAKTADIAEDEAKAARKPELRGMQALREDRMMAHLLDSLEAGKDIGHYGRLTFAMVARHFLTQEEMLAELMKDRDFTEEPHDPDCGNVYRSLRFEGSTYKHIEEYQEEKMAAER
jgi:hypothetical protein